MMKKQIITLLLSATILTAAPLWAMDDEAEKVVIHKCPSCHPDLQFLNIKEDAGKGDSIPVTLISTIIILPEIIEEIPLEDLIHALPFVSKAMYNACQTSVIWAHILAKAYRAEKRNFDISDVLCAKDAVIKKLHPLPLFGDKNKVYNCRLTHLPPLTFLGREPAPYNGKFTSTYTFNGGNKKFELKLLSNDLFPEGSTLESDTPLRFCYRTDNSSFSCTHTVQDGDICFECEWSIKEIEATNQ